MPHHSPREHQEERERRYAVTGDVEAPDVWWSAPKYQHFLNQDGEILFTISDRPHVGFHSALPGRDDKGNPRTE